MINELSFLPWTLRVRNKYAKNVYTCRNDTLHKQQLLTRQKGNSIWHLTSVRGAKNIAILKLRFGTAIEEPKVYGKITQICR